MKLYPILIMALLTACSKGEPDNAQQAGETAAPAAPVALAPGAAITSAAAATIGMTIAGEIKPQGTSQFYRFDNPFKLRDIVLVRLENKSATLRPDIKIYNDERSLQSEKYDGTAGANVELPLTVEPGKSIYVEVLPYDLAGAYQLSARAQKAYDQYEPNDDQLATTPVNFGSSVEANVLDGKDNDWYHFTAPTTGKVTIAFENLSPELSPDVKVYSQAKSLVLEKYDGTPGAGQDFNVDLQPGQDFYVQVLPYGKPGKYRLTARPAVLAADMQNALKAKGAIGLYGIYFDTDQSFVKPQSAATLTEVASLMKADPSLRLEIAGHTDNQGAKAHNQALSQARADAVVQALVGQYGIDAGRLAAKGYGDSAPVAPNDNPDNMAKNWRVELRKI